MSVEQIYIYLSSSIKQNLNNLVDNGENRNSIYN